MGSALTSCAGGSAPRATGKRRRRHSSARCLTAPATAPQLFKAAVMPGWPLHLQPQIGVAPDVLPQDINMWSSSRRTAGGERSGTPSPASASPRTRLSREEASVLGGGEADASASTAIAANSSKTIIDARRFDQRALFSSTGAVTSIATVGQHSRSACAVRSTVDLVRDIGEICASPVLNICAADAASGGSSMPPQAPGCSRVGARFRIISQPSGAQVRSTAADATVGVSRLCRSASEALSVAFHWPSSAGSGAAVVTSLENGRATAPSAEQCVVRPVTGDFTSWTVIGKRSSANACCQSETKVAATAATDAVVRHTDVRVERTPEEAPDLTHPSRASPRMAKTVARPLSTTGDDCNEAAGDYKETAGGCNSFDRSSLNAKQCDAAAAAVAAAADSADIEDSQPPSEQLPSLPQLPARDGSGTSLGGSSGCSSSGDRSSASCSDADPSLLPQSQALPGVVPITHGGRPTQLTHSLTTLGVERSKSGDDSSSSSSSARLRNPPPSPSGSVRSSIGKPPPKPPRTYSYRASLQPKRISRTTEEFVAMWDKVRRSLLSGQTVDDASELADGGGGGDDEEDDCGIYMNHYAARARGWQILSLAQEALAQRLDASSAVNGLARLGHVDEPRCRALLCEATRSGRDVADALIDVILEKGDTCFDAFRSVLRCDDSDNGGSPQTDLAQLLDTLDDVLSIGVAASGRNFTLTTKQCSVTCGDGRRDESIGSRWNSLIGHRGAAVAAAVDSDDDDCNADSNCGLDGSDNDDGPTCALDLYGESFGDASCERLAVTVRERNRVSSLRLAKNGITAVGANALSMALIAAAADGSAARLTHLDLRLNTIGNDGLASIATALRSAACQLEVLVLSHAGLTPGCGRLLADALLPSGTEVETKESGLAHKEATGEKLRLGRQRRLLRFLDISHNEADDSDCDALAEALGGAGGAPLRRLNLRGNAFGARGCAHLCAALAGGRGGGCRLASLDVSQNSVLDEGARALAAALTSPACCLRELFAEGCGVTAAGCAALCAALTAGRANAGAAAPPLRSLSALSLSNNPIADEGLRCLGEALATSEADDIHDSHESASCCSRESGGLRTLRVDLCGGSPEAVGSVLRALRLRNRSLLARNCSLEALSARRAFDRCSAASCCSLLSSPPPPIVASDGHDAVAPGPAIDARSLPQRIHQMRNTRVGQRGGSRTET